ncbi:MAG: T9SS type A sorting domain-containing protein [Lewinellaceae bacterium]|nr:T9SS type A sorting domain-containing protein [Lewinellaceae bacterium]
MRFTKIQSLYFFALIAAVWCTNSALNPGNPPTAKTGAPGETTCSTSSGCHSGGNFTGTLAIQGLPDTVVPNQSYMLTMLHSSNASRCGFQMTTLDSANLKAGAFTAGSGSNVSNAASGRQYIRQSSAKNLNNGMASWTFSWKAPATAGGNAMTFYLASLAANGNGAKTGDNALTHTQKVVLKNNPVSASQEPNYSADIRLFPNPATAFVEVQVPVAATVTAFNLQGQTVFQKALQNGTTGVDIQHWPAGTYVFRIQIGNQEISKKIEKI